MALTDFEKDCITEIHTGITRKQHTSQTPQDKLDLDAILHGDDAARQAVIAAYITDVGLADVAARIAACDEEISNLQATKTALQAKETAMQNYSP